MDTLAPPEVHRVPGDVRRYYDLNTRRMLRWGVGRSEGVLHRPVWDPACHDKREALHAVERRIVGILAPSAPGHVLDLGCGAGASAVWIAGRMPSRITGVTLSPLQARLAGQRSASRGVADRCRFLVADFSRMTDVEPADAAYAIESFSHAPDADAFFAEQARILVKGALLLICDDVLERDEPRDTNEARVVRRFQDGWRLPSLCTADQARRQAGKAGFLPVADEDLTPLLHLTPLPGIVLAKLLAFIPFLDESVRSSFAGGMALQVCLRRAFIRYRFLVFRLDKQ